MQIFSEDHFVLANSVDPDEMPHYVAYNLDLSVCSCNYKTVAFIHLLTE